MQKLYTLLQKSNTVGLKSVTTVNNQVMFDFIQCWC